MDSTTVTASTFTVTSGTPAVAVLGTVRYANAAATFWPSAHFASNSVYTASVKTGAQKRLRGLPSRLTTHGPSPPAAH